MKNIATVRRSPSNNVQIIKIEGAEREGCRLERNHISITKLTLGGEREVKEVTTRNIIAAKKRANSFAAVTSVSLNLDKISPSIEKIIDHSERLEEVKTSIVRMLVDRDLVAKENNDLKRYIQCVEWLTGENRRLRQEIANIRRQDVSRSDPGSEEHKFL